MSSVAVRSAGWLKEHSVRRASWRTARAGVRWRDYGRLTAIMQGNV
jgi:hypothetical protein